jgi:hypothetical protein
MRTVVSKSDDCYAEFNDLYSKLTNIARQFTDTSTLGNSNFSAEANQGNNIIRYLQYSGGYESSLRSEKFDFIIWESYTDALGTCFRFENNPLQGMKKCLVSLTEE